jgi:preprotein translocase subunit SecA
MPSSANRLMSKLTDTLQSQLTFPDELSTIIIQKIVTTTSLQIIDRYRIDHIDTMQQVRDKVGLMSYARLDPLVAYKKEAYELFEQLNYNINHDIVIQISQIDRSNIQDKLAARTAKIYSRRDSGLTDSLRAAAASAPSISTQDKKPRTQIQSDEDGVEIIQLDEATSPDSDTVIQTKSSKLRPNDRITIRHTDGKIEYEVKYKKVKDLIESGKAEVVQ